MRRDVYYYFQQAYHRPLQPNPSPLRFVSDGDVAAAFLVRIDPPDKIESVEYRCTTCMTLVAVCEHISEELQGSTIARARTLTAERILEQHPEIPDSRHSRARLAAAAAQAALENLLL
jgi:NifU-like protein involved in Fe-S cluster formation